MTNYSHFGSMKMTNDLIVSSRIYIALWILVFVYLCWLRMLERCAVVATIIQLYRTFPERLSSVFEFIFLTFKTALWITLVDYFGEENCKFYYESDIVGLCGLRFCNCLKSGLYFTKAEEPYACTDMHRLSSFRPSAVPILRFDSPGPRASREVGPLRDYLNLLRSNAGKGVMIHYDQDSGFTDERQTVFKEINKLMRFNESYMELFAPRKRELLAEVRIWEKGVILPGAWIMCTTDYMIVFQDFDAGASLCEIMTKSGKSMYKRTFPSRLSELERMLEGLLPVVKYENFGLASSCWSFWGMNILHSSSFDELFDYLLSDRQVYLTRSQGGQPTLVLGEKLKTL